LCEPHDVEPAQTMRAAFDRLKIVTTAGRPRPMAG
jgi:hypothetical protein